MSDLTVTLSVSSYVDQPRGKRPQTVVVHQRRRVSDGVVLVDVHRFPAGCDDRAAEFLDEIAA